MKKFLAVAGFIGLFAIAVCSEEIVDKTLAIVNGEALMSSEYNKIVAPMIDQYRATVPLSEQSDEKLNELKNNVLNQRVEQMLLVQEAKKAKIKIPKKDIEEAVKQVKKRFVDDSEFTVELKKEGLTVAQFEKRLEEQLMSMKFVEQEMKSKVKAPTEEQVKKYYDNLRLKMKGGNLGLPQEEEEAMSTVATLLKRMSEEQIRIRQIYVKLDKNASAEEKKAAQARVANIKKEIAKGGSFAELSEKYSEDNLLKQRKGDMGLVVRGDLPKEIEDVIFPMNVGEYTKDAIKTDTGYHFIRVEEKRASRIFSFDDVKNDLAEVLYQQDGKKAYDKWIADLKSKSNIKVNQL